MSDDLPTPGAARQTDPSRAGGTPEPGLRQPLDRGDRSHPGSAGPEGTSPVLDLERIVRPVRRRMAAQLLLGWALRGAAAALLGAAAFVAAGHLLTWPAGDPLGGPRGWAILVAVAVAIGVLAIVARRWPSVDQALAEADRRMGLKDRLTTAREFAGRDSELIVLQRRELGRALRGVDLRQAVCPRLPRREAGLIGLGALLVLGATLLPNPQATAQARQRQQQQVARYAAARTAALVRPPQAPVPPKGGQPVPEGRNMRAVQSVLHRLQGQLAGAKSAVQALKALTAAQQSLQHLNTQGAQAQQSLAAAAHALASGQTSALSRALRAGNPATTRKALGALAKALPKLSAADRQAVAKALAKAAAAAGQQGALAQALQRAAQAAGSDPAAASPSLASLAQQLQEAQASAAAASTSARALQDLARIKQDVANGVGGPQQQSPAGSSRSPALPRTGRRMAPRRRGSQPGKGSGSKNGGGKGAAGQPGKGGGAKGGAQGQQGAGQGKGQGRAGGNGGKGGTGKGLASGGQAGNGGQGGAASSSGGAGNGPAGSSANGVGSGHGSSGHGGAGGNAGTGGQGTGRFERVYLPGERHGGPSTQTQGELGRSVQVQSGAFRQLVSQYAQAADSTLGRTALPPDRQAAVKRYFQSLEQN